MYLINIELEVNWKILSTMKTYVLEEWDVVIKDPEGNQTYVDSAIVSDDFLPPTTTTDGYVTYRFTPTSLGVWSIALTSGLGTIHYVYYEHILPIAVNDTFTQKKVASSRL